MRLVAEAMPFDTDYPSEWPKVQALLPHALAAAEAAERNGAGTGRCCDRAQPDRLSTTNRVPHGPRPSRSTSAPSRSARRRSGRTTPTPPPQLNNLAGLYQDTGRLAEAEPLYERALAITEKALGPDHPDLAIRLNNLAELYRATGRLAEAEPLLERAVAILEKVLPADHPSLATVRENLAVLRAERDREVRPPTAAAPPPSRPAQPRRTAALRDRGPAAPRLRRPLSAPRAAPLLNIFLVKCSVSRPNLSRGLPCPSPPPPPNPPPPAPTAP